MNNIRQTMVQKLIIGSGYSYLPLIINKAIGIITSVFLARSLGPKNFGMISIINYLMFFLIFITGMGIPTAIVKLIAEYHTKGENKLDDFISSAFLTNLVLIFLITLIYFFAAHYIANNIYHESTLVTLLQISALTLLFLSLNQYGNSIIQGFAEFRKLSALLIFSTLVGLLFLIPLTKLFGLKGAILSQSITSISTFSFLLWVLRFLRKKYSLTITLNVLNPILMFQNTKHYLPKLFSLALPVFISGIVMNPVLPILTTLLSRYRSFVEVGFFNISYSLSQIIIFIPMAVGTAFVPLATKLATEDDSHLNDFLLKTIYGVTIIVMTLSFLLSFFSKEIILLFYGQNFSQAQNILIPYSAAIFLASFGYIIGYYLLATGKMWLATLLNFIWFIIIIAPSFYFIKHLGLIGLGLIYFISYFILTIIFIFYLKKSLKVDISRLTLCLGNGLFFLVAIFLMRLFKLPNLFHIVLFVLFFITLFLLLPKTLDKTFFKQLVGTWLHKTDEIE